MQRVPPEPAPRWEDRKEVSAPEPHREAPDEDEEAYPPEPHWEAPEEEEDLEVSTPELHRQASEEEEEDVEAYALEPRWRAPEEEVEEEISAPDAQWEHAEETELSAPEPLPLTDADVVDDGPTQEVGSVDERHEHLRPGHLHEPEPPQPNGSGAGTPWSSAAEDPPGSNPPTPPRPRMPAPFEQGDRAQPAQPPPEHVSDRSAGRTAAAQAVLQRRRQALTEGRRRGGRRWIIPLLLAIGLIGAVGLWLVFSLFQPFAGEGEGQVRVVIPQGVGVGQIADLLAEREVISSPFFFTARARVSGRAGDLKPGTFRLRKGMSHVAALDALSEGPPPDVVRVTIPEGRARREVKQLLGNQLKGDYLALTRRSPLLDPRRYGAKRATSLEGFLFPATYELKRKRPMADLVALQLRAFKRELAKVDLRAARRKNLTPYDVLTIASMVDREAQIPRERRLVASVIYNRLREGIPLGIDATIRFATNNWTRPLTQSQLAIDSPYNTRSRKGLPPGPIGSPGLAAIRAAARPAGTGFLFYVVKPGTCGEHAFSKTDAEFQRDVSRYNTERTRRGGKSPTNC